MSSTVDAALSPLEESAAEARTEFRYWQKRILFSSMIGYAFFYFVRKNLSFAAPHIMEEYGLSKRQMGLASTTLHGLVYGVARFVNGMWADRVNARWFMAAGLLACGVINFFFGLSSAFAAFAALWALNGWFQGMGFPPCTRLMTHWFPPHRLATTMSVWNVGHSLGGAGVAVLCGYLVAIDWRYCFFVPAIIAMAGSLFLAIALRDTPESLGLPPVEGTEHTEVAESEPMWRTLRQLVFTNRYIWLLSLANFFVYVVRYGVVDWAPTFLKQARGLELAKSAGWTVGAFEAAGILGMVTSGWITDRVFGGRGTRTCLVYMLGCSAALCVFWLYPSTSVYENAAVLAVAGFFIYGPQCLIGISAANLATKRAAAASAGLTGLFGYASTLVSGVGVGWLADHSGWDAAFLLLFVAGMIGTALFALCWPAQAHGYK
ncbi:MAG: MFS transporter [Pirellulales bacterium]|nr:MFS transporter [Pirellulales bacterium]